MLAHTKRLIPAMPSTPQLNNALSCLLAQMTGVSEDAMINSLSLLLGTWLKPFTTAKKQTKIIHKEESPCTQIKP